MQGVSYLAGMVQLYAVDAMTSFVTLANLLHHPLMYNIFSFEAANVDVIHRPADAPGTEAHGSLRSALC